MADISVTAANVVRVSGSVNKDYNAGETITAGQVVYLKTSNTLWMKAQSDGTAEEAGSATQTGFALHGSVLNQPLAVQTTGVINPGGTVVVGAIYAISVSAGGIGLYSELASTNKIGILGIGATVSTIDMDKVIKGYPGIVVP